MIIDKFTFGMRGHDLANDFDGMIKSALENNITKLQFAPKKTMVDVDFDKTGYDTAVAERMSEKLSSNNLNVSVLGCYIDPINPDTLEYSRALFENFIPYAKAVNATVIGTETGYVPIGDKARFDQSYKVFIETLERLLPVAEKNGVTIGIEPVWCGVVRSVDVMKDVLDYFKSDNLKVIFDPVNLLYDGNYTEQDAIVDSAFERLGENIKVLHLKDFDAAEGFRKVAVGEGMFNVKDCLDKLAKFKDIPDVMLDEMPLSKLHDVTENLKKILLG